MSSIALGIDCGLMIALTGGQLLLPFAASIVTGVLGIEAVRQLNEGSALKDPPKKRPKKTKMQTIWSNSRNLYR